MDIYLNQPTLEASEGGPASSAELVTISKAELEALIARADAAPVKRDSGPFQMTATTDAASSHSSEEAESNGREREAYLTRELSERDRRLTELDRACKIAVCERDLATVLAGKPLVSGAAAQLTKLWRDDFDVYEEGGAYKVMARDGRPVGQVVSQLLASPEYFHFCLPSSRGGTGAQGASRPQDAVANPKGPKNLGEAVVMKWREESATRPDNFLKPIGLRRHR
jgi:hypothetical protein